MGAATDEKASAAVARVIFAKFIGSSFVKSRSAYPVGAPRHCLITMIGQCDDTSGCPEDGCAEEAKSLKNLVKKHWRPKRCLSRAGVQYREQSSDRPSTAIPAVSALA